MSYFILTTSQFNLPPGLLYSLCYVESKHNSTIIHINDGGTDSYGICQIKLETARFLGYKGTEKGLLNPKINIYYAGKYLNYQRTRYYDIIKAIVAYNKGNSNKLTKSEYSDKVLKHWRDNRWNLK